MNNEENIQLINLVTRELTGEASNEDLDVLESLLVDTENKKLAEDFRKAWKASHSAQGITDDEVKTEWRRIEEVIDSNGQEVKKYPWMKIAAAISFIIVGSMFVLWDMMSVEKYEISADVVREYELPDGSLITLNRGSSIEYNDEFNEQIREIWLTGESYFDVVSDSERPFIIHTGAGDVQVVGTSFNVNSDNQSGVASVVVTSGVVKLFNVHSAVTLKKGEMGVASSAAKQIEKSSAADSNLLAWRTRNITFDNTPLLDVVDVLNKVYNKNIKIENTQLSDCPVTVSFNDQPLDDILLILSSTLDIEIKTVSGAPVLTGSGCQ